MHGSRCEWEYFEHNVDDYDIDQADNAYDPDKAAASRARKIALERQEIELATATANAMSGGGGSSNTTMTTSNTTNNPSSGGGGNQSDPYRQKNQALEKYMAKFDPSQYNDLKNDFNFAAWTAQFKRQVKVNGMEDVFDPNVDPTQLTGYRKEFYDSANLLLFNVLCKVLLTDKGQDILLDHEDTKMSCPLSVSRTSYLHRCQAL